MRCSTRGFRLRRLDQRDVGIMGTSLRAHERAQVRLVDILGHGRPDADHVAFKVEDADAAKAEVRVQDMSVPALFDRGIGRRTSATNQSSTVSEPKQPVSRGSGEPR